VTVSWEDVKRAGRGETDASRALFDLDQYDDAGPPPPVGRPATTRASDITKTRVQWLWQGRLALGYLAVWCGAGDIGKSMFAAWTIGELTHGRLPGRFLDQPQDALIVCTEDGRDDMWRPRLEAVGADLDRVHFLDYPAGWNLRDGIDWIDTGVTEAVTALVFVDALMSHMPDAQGGENTRSPTFVRGALQPFADLCKRQKVTGLFGLHPRKAGGDTFADVVQESGVFTQLPRLGLLFGYHPEDLELPQDQQRRVILRGKGNIGRNPGALSFRIAERFLEWGDDDPDPEGIGYITDVQPCTVTERELLATKRRDADRPTTKVQQAEGLIGMALRDGAWHPAKPIRAQLERLKLNNNGVVNQAKVNLGVKSRQQETGAASPPWEWRNPGSSISDAETDSVPSRAMFVDSLTVYPQNPPNPNEYGQSQRVSPNERNGDRGGTELESQQNPRAGAGEAPTDCAYPDLHGQHHHPHPDTGRTVCTACHPIPEPAA
jgi:AAA domain